MATSSNHPSHHHKEHAERTRHQAESRTSGWSPRFILHAGAVDDEPLRHTCTHTHTLHTLDTCTHLHIHATHTCRQHTHTTHAPNTCLDAHIHSHHKQTHTDADTHHARRHTPHQQMHRPTWTHVAFHGSFKWEPHCSSGAHPWGEPSLTLSPIKSALQETRKLKLGPFLCSGYCA